MYNHILYLGYWLVGAATFYFSSFLISSVTLGNGRFSGLEAAFYAAFWLTFLVWVFWDFAIARKINLDNKIYIFIFFFLVNCFAILVVSIASRFTGFRLFDYEYVALVGGSLTIFQRIVWSFIVRRG